MRHRTSPNVFVIVAHGSRHGTAGRRRADAHPDIDLVNPPPPEFQDDWDDDE